MCNIATYNGPDRAAPILLEMLRRQEGLDSGFFSGIATVADGKLHVRKVEGSVDVLVRDTDAADLPGTIGIIHGRTPGTGREKWAHPFISTDGKFALAENGTTGAFNDNPKYCRLAAELEDQGYRFRSRCEEKDENHCRMPDGTWVHCSDMITQLMERQIKANGGDIVQGMTSALAIAPVGVGAGLVPADHQDRKSGV